MIQERVFTALSTNEDVIAIAGAKIYPMQMPPAAVLPAIVYDSPSMYPIFSLDGDSGLDNVTFTVTCWATTYLQVNQLAAAVRKAIVEESDLRAVTQGQEDHEDSDTHNYGIVIKFTMWT